MLSRHPRVPAMRCALGAVTALLASGCGAPTVDLPPVGTPVSARVEVVVRPGLGTAPERLAAGLTITPMVALTYTVRGGELAVRPVTAFTPTTRYTLTLGSGQASQREKVTGSSRAPAAAWSFVTRAPRLAYWQRAPAAVRLVGLDGQQADLAAIPTGHQLGRMGVSAGGDEVWYEARDADGGVVLERLPVDGAPRSAGDTATGRPTAQPTAAWTSPDGRHSVALSVAAGGPPTRTFFVVRDTVTGAGRELREPGGGIRAPAWSPDGRWLAYVYEPELAAVGREAGAEAPSLLVVNGPDGRGRRVVAGETGGRIDEPAWSPDGQWLAYLVRPPQGAPGLPRLWIAPADGGERRPLAEGVTAFTWVP